MEKLPIPDAFGQNQREESDTDVLTIRPDHLPSLIQRAGRDAERRCLEFFTAQIRNPGTREAYGRAVNRFFLWCEQRSVSLDQISPFVVAAYIEQLCQLLKAPTVKLHLAAIQMLFDWLVTGQIVPVNPATSVRGPKHVVRKGRTPALSSAEARQLLNAIDCTMIIGLRDRALIGVMTFTFARVSAAVSMNVEDCYTQGRRMWFRLHEKGGKRHDVPAHHTVEAYVDDYLKAADIESNGQSPLFRTVSRQRRLTERRMHRNDVLRMIKRRARIARLPKHTCCHTFRATGITVYLENGGSLEHAQRIAAHNSVRTTKLYDRTSDAVSLDEIERIVI